MLKKNRFFSCLLISSTLHAIILCFVWSIVKKDIYISTPIEVVFYSESRQISDQFFDTTSRHEEEIKNPSLDKNNFESPGEKEEIVKDAVIDKDIATIDKKEKIKKISVKKKQSKNGKKLSDNKVPKKDGVKSIRQTSDATGIGNNSNIQTYNAQDNDSSKFGIGSQYESLAFEDKNFKFSYYASQIVSKIKRSWSWSLSYSKLKAIIYFKIHRDGSVSGVSVKKSSKNSEYDKFAIDTIIRASPFPQLPDGYNEDFLGVYFEFVAN
ncbi:MAG: TonB C-terminal domain-containing protein [Endomicrobium sp.]|uniref:energy transducer TonB n=1 Tax=Candidatus Endomicrobiellum cubanum TaxID=3242325 RepID=UPI00282AABE0|nr:TonB C-terminal domain-containing protein [Endomicrobium sp.]